MKITLAMRWDGDAMRPVGRFAAQAKTEFVAGENYLLEVIEQRSAKSHAHYFSVISECWANLRDQDAERFKTPEQLRKWALIKCGYFDLQSLVCSSNAEAIRVQAFMKPIDEFAVVTVHDNIVLRFTAKSQSTRAMGAKDFQESKQRVLDLLADMIGTTTKQLSESGSA